MDNKKDKRKDKEIKTSVYSIRLTKKEKDLLTKNPEIKKQLDEIVLQYINSFL